MNWFGPPGIAPRCLPGARRLLIGLINNMPDGAVQSTDRQFSEFLSAAAAGQGVEFRRFTCPEIARAVSPVGWLGEPYADIAALFDTQLDALVVTGMEPKARRLEDEPIWPNLTRVADWAQLHAVPVIWSCLAAHAVVFHFDGIDRVRLPQKLSGRFTFGFERKDIPLASGMPSQWCVPHSRLHGLPEAALQAHGYQILSRSEEAGVDIFLRHSSVDMRANGAPFLFFQGHPEYDADTLLREYRRDVRRYLAGDTDTYPEPPRYCFDDAAEEALAAIRQRVCNGDRDPMLADEIGRVLNGLAAVNVWRAPALRICANWLDAIRQDDLHPPAHASSAAVTLGGSA